MKQGKSCGFSARQIMAVQFGSLNKEALQDTWGFRRWFHTKNAVFLSPWNDDPQIMSYW